MIMKKYVFIFGIIFVCLILSFSVVSAGWFNNFFEKITGKPTVGIKNIKVLNCVDYENANPQMDPTVKGYIEVTYTINNGQSITETRTDECSDEKRVKEYWCKNTEIKKRPVMSNIKCDVGKTCEDGRCVGGLVCNETDQGEDYDSYGETSGWDSFAHQYTTKTDVCIGEELTEYYCIYTGEIGSKTVVCPHGCDDYGACIEPATSGNSQNCTDTDNGIKALTTGTVSGQSNSLWIQTPFTDKCTMQGFTSNFPVPAVIEGYCGVDGQAHSLTIECINGCTNSTNGIGSCKFVAGASGCIDSDNGANYSLMGNVAGTHYGLDGWSLTDSCHTTINGQEDYLTEGYCENNEAKFINILCEKGTCLGGVCIPKTANSGNNNGNGNTNVNNENQNVNGDNSGVGNRKGYTLSPENKVGQETGYCKCYGNFEDDNCRQFKTQEGCKKNVCSGNYSGAEIVKKCVWVSSEF